MLSVQLYRVSYKKVSIKNFYSELLKALIHSLLIYLDSVYICKFGVSFKWFGRI